MEDLPLPYDPIPKRPKFAFSLKEWLVFLIATAFAIASFRPDDAVFVGLILLISWLAFLGICYKHEGNLKWRALAAIGWTLVLVDIGVRPFMHPKSVLVMEARMEGVYGPSVPFTQFYLNIRNPPSDAIQNLNLIVGTTSNLIIKSIEEVPSQGGDCKLEVVDVFPDAKMTFRGSDGKSGFTIDTKDVTNDMLKRFGSQRWRLACSRFGGNSAMSFMTTVQGDASNDSVQTTGTYELIPSEGSRVVQVNTRIAVTR
jgi:hypothetical protein